MGFRIVINKMALCQSNIARSSAAPSAGDFYEMKISFLEKCGDYNQSESITYYQAATLSPDDYSYYETITSDGGISVSTNDDAQGILLVLKV